VGALPSIRSDPAGSASKASTPFIRVTVSAPASRIAGRTRVAWAKRAGPSCRRPCGESTSQKNRAWLDGSTTTARRRLLLTVLGRLAEFDRELIRARTGEGRERAKARGVKMGRPPKLTDHQRREAIKRREHGEETLAEIGRSYNVSGQTIAQMSSASKQHHS